MPDRVVLVKDGVQFTKIAPGGFRILEVVNKTARLVGVNLTITSACDGMHSGPDDPHHRGEAYDIRTHDLGDQKLVVLNAILSLLPSANFFAFLESPDTPNEHIHIQVRKDTTYP